MAKRFLIVHLAANGDCLMMTTIAEQLKKDHPGAHLTWAIGTKCKQVIENNPAIDAIWEIDYTNNEHALHVVFPAIKKQAEERKEKGEFDEIIYSQLLPDNLHHFDGTTRSSTFRAYPQPITIDVSPIIHLREEEKVKVAAFAEQYNLASYKQVVLCECAPTSGQSAMTIPLMLGLADTIARQREDILFIISSHIKIESPHPRIIDASVLSYRENAALSHYCNFLIGCSSGITWLLTSRYAKKINTVQFITPTAIPFRFASVAYDFTYWKLSTDHIIESSANDPAIMTAIVQEALLDFSAAKKIRHEYFKPSIKALAKNIQELFRKYGLVAKEKVRYCMRVFFERNKVTQAGRFYILLFRNWLVLKISVKKIFYRVFHPSKAGKY